MPGLIREEIFLIFPDTKPDCSIFLTGAIIVIQDSVLIASDYRVGLSYGVEPGSIRLVHSIIHHV